MPNELIHYQILGAKWGIRRFQNYDGTLTAAGKVRYRKDVGPNRKPSKNVSVKKNSAEPRDRYKPVNDMTDQEIRDFLARRDLEAKYIAAITPAEIAPAKSATQKYIEKFGTKLLDKTIEKGTDALAKTIVESIFGKTGDDKKPSPASNNDKKNSLDKAEQKTKIDKQKIENALAKAKLHEKKPEVSEIEKLQLKRERYEFKMQQKNDRIRIANEKREREKEREKALEEKRKREYQGRYLRQMDCSLGAYTRFPAVFLGM